MNIGVVLAAGDSQRFGGYMHKQYLKLNGKEVVSYGIREMQKSGVFDEVLLVVDPEEYKSQYISKKYGVKSILGGETRNKSIKNAIDYIEANYKCDKVLFHDSVRPLIKASRFVEMIKALDDYDAVITVGQINDGLVDTEYNHVKRDNYLLVQAPEAFRFGVLKTFNEDSRAGSIVSQFTKISVLQIPSDVFNMKIMYPEDLFICEQLSRLNYYSVNHNAKFMIGKLPEKVLLLGGSGGVGQAIKEFLVKNGIEFRAPSHRELDLATLSVEKLKEYCKDFVPDAIINAAAIYYDDNEGLSATFDAIFAVNVKANEILIEYAKTVGKKINIVFMSSSSSTKGRENLTNYAAAKSARNSIGESQARILAEQNIFINAVIPEKVNTPLIKKLHKVEINERELLEPEDVIQAIMYFAVANEFGRLVHIRKGL